MTAALAERPTGKDLMPLVLAKLRQTTSNPSAADWIPESVLVPPVEWMTKEPKPGEDFFADQKQEQDLVGYWLFHNDGTIEGKQSMSGSDETMLFRLPEGSWQLDGIKVFSARYGADEPPQEEISIYLCDEEFELLHEVRIPYSHFERGEEKWHSVSFAPVNVTKTFYLGIDFHATATKGVYVGMDKGARRSHSRIALPYAHVNDLKGFWGGSAGMTCGQLRSRYEAFDPARHGKSCNQLFCDGHVAAMGPWVLFNPTTTGAMWTSDHQPHPQLWQP